MWNDWHLIGISLHLCGIYLAFNGNTVVILRVYIIYGIYVGMFTNIDKPGFVKSHEISNLKIAPIYSMDVPSTYFRR